MQGWTDMKVELVMKMNAKEIASEKNLPAQKTTMEKNYFNTVIKVEILNAPIVRFTSPKIWKIP